MNTPNWVPSAEKPETVIVKGGDNLLYEAIYYKGNILVRHRWGQYVPYGVDPQACYEYSLGEFLARYHLADES